MASEPLLSVRNLEKHFPIFGQGIVSKQIGWVRAVSDVTFDVFPGETLGLVGESGSGKTTTARTILRALRPTGGQVLFRSKSGVVDLAQLSEKALIPLRTELQMVFQDPVSSLNPRMSIEQIVGEPLTIHNLARGVELKRRVVEMLERVGLRSEHLARYPHEFSGGQRQRIGIARSLVMNPSLLILDEPVSALDVSVQAQVINLLSDLRRELNLTSLFVAHDLSVVRYLCDRVAVMYAGRVVEIAPTEDLFQNPQHPYTRALLAAVPNADPDIPMDFSVPGEVANPANLPPGCSFHPRCPERFALCSELRPELQASRAAQVACHARTLPVVSA
ncbi:MAG: ATP-binding cassette domain-containing protein [Polyangiaceae bacterium]|nr:ATP-binding cassette domain-containing protein [Polyangiaceae bacterium]